MKYLTYILLMLFLLSCSKEGMIKVKTINKVTGTPMPKVTIYVVEQFSNNDPNETVFIGETNNNGDLVIDIKFKRNGKYTITQAQVENSCWHSDKSLSLEKTKNQNVIFEFAPCAQLKLKIENVNCEGAGDNFKLYYEGRQVGGQGDNIVGAQMRDEDGCYSFESTSFSNVPMGERYYRWEVTRNGVTEEFHDTIYLEEGEQKVYEILY